MVTNQSRVKLCKPKLQPWADVLMHIHIAVGKLVNVKAVSWLINMHTATVGMPDCEKLQLLGINCIK